MVRLELKELTKDREGTCVSIYLPTHRNSLEIDQDRTRFKNLLTEAKKELESKGINAGEFLKDAEALHGDYSFWDYRSDGLAILVDDENTFVINLNGETPEKVTVGNRYHLIPLLNFYEILNDVYLLDISKDRFDLYFGNSESIEKVDLPEGIYTRFTDLYDDKDVESDLQLTGRSGTGFHGNKSKSEEDEKDVEKYHRYVADELDKYFGEEKFPLVLFGTTEVIADFSNKASNLNIVAHVEKPLSSLSVLQTYKELKDILLPIYIDKMSVEIDNLKSEIGKDKGTDNASRILNDKDSGRIGKLFIEKDYDGLSTDEIDQIIQGVSNTDGEIVIVDKSKNDFDLGIGAVYRY